MVNVEIAPGNQSRIDVYIAAYNADPNRSTPKLKYTDVVNEALDRFLSRHFAEDRSNAGDPARSEDEQEEER